MQDPPFTPLPDSADFRAFFYGLFGESTKRRRFILMNWHTKVAVAPTTPRLACLFETFIKRVLLYDGPARFSMRGDHFCLLDAHDLRIPYTWLTDEERHFIVYSVYGHRKSLFGSVKRYENNEFLLEEFHHDSPQLYDASVWGREMVRDFCWLAAAKRQAFLVHELIVALQNLMTNHGRGRRDVFLKALHDGLQGTCELARVPCWGLEAFDLHPEERESATTSAVQK